jgi:thiamine-phosphate pyrophosphorylase
MEVAEAGADYVAFGASAAGEPVLDDDGAAMDELDGLPTSRDEFIAWWSEVFEVACVALDVGTADEARVAAGAGADFVAVAIAATTTPDEAAGRVRAIAQAIGGGGRA